MNKSLLVTSSLIVSSILLGACGGSGGPGGERATSALGGATCREQTKEFTPGSKVQITAGLPGGMTMDMIDQNDPILIGAARRPVDGQASVDAGTRLTAIIKNSCTATGPISSLIERDPSTEASSGVRSYPFVLPRTMTRDELSGDAEADACVEGISDTSISYAEGIFSDPMVREQDQFRMLDADPALPLFYDKSLGKRRPVVIAIIDTGVDIDHEDLKDVVWTNSGEIPGNRKDDDRNGYVDDVHGYNFADSKADPRQKGSWRGNHHGTHVAGLAAAKGGNRIGGSGVMGAGAKIMALNVFGNDPGAFSYHTENAIRYAADNGADVINLSIGGTAASAGYKSAVTYAVSKGVTILAAAGNSRREISPGYFVTPGGYGRALKGMMAVASIDSSDFRWSVFSNYSESFVEIAAPGSEDTGAGRGLLSTMPGNRYARLQGTSMASPVAAGAAALAIQLIRARGYNATPARVEDAMTSSAENRSSLASRVKDGRVLNLKGLAAYIDRKYPVKSSPETDGSRLSEETEGVEEGVPSACP